MRQLIFMPKSFGRPLYPFGMPIHYRSDQWKGNVKEVIHTAVCKYYDVHIGGRKDLNDEERQVLFEYIVYHINAPIWDAAPGNLELLEQLRNLADDIDSIEKLENYLLDAMDAGLDPL